MFRRIITGILAGLLAGVAFGILMTLIKVPNGQGEKVLMMRVVAMVVGSESLVIGWLYHFFNASVIGGMFGALYGDKIKNFKSGAQYGSMYGVVWWISGGLILMPVFLGNHVFGPLIYEEMRPLAYASLLGHLIYGLILGIASAAIKRRRNSTSAK